METLQIIATLGLLTIAIILLVLLGKAKEKAKQYKTELDLEKLNFDKRTNDYITTFNTMQAKAKTSKDRIEELENANGTLVAELRQANNKIAELQAVPEQMKEMKEEKPKTSSIGDLDALPKNSRNTSGKAPSNRRSRKS